MSDIDPGKQIGRNIFSAQKLTERSVRQISEPVNSQAAPNVTEIRTCTYCHRINHLLWSLLRTQRTAAAFKSL